MKYTQLHKIYNDYVEQVEEVSAMIDFFSLFTSETSVFNPLLEVMDELEHNILTELGLVGTDGERIVANTKPKLAIVSKTVDEEQLNLDLE